MGGMFSWEHVLSTTDPTYYKWTQWLFLQLLERGLAYKKKGASQLVPRCKTVLSNEQVIAGECERCGSTVRSGVLEQWYFRITEYAERLLANLDDPAEDGLVGIDRAGAEELARSLRRRRGRASPSRNSADVEDHRRITTRPDTLFGATFLVLAPEHPLVAELTTASQRDAAAAYRAEARAKDLVTRKVGDKEKTGVHSAALPSTPQRASRSRSGSPITC